SPTDPGYTQGSDSLRAQVGQGRLAMAPPTEEVGGAPQGDGYTTTPQAPCRAGVNDLDRHPEVRVLFARASQDAAPTHYGAISPIAFLRLSNGLGPAPCAGASVFTSRLFAVMMR